MNETQMKIYDISHQYNDFDRSINQKFCGRLLYIYIQMSYQFVMSIQRSLKRASQPRNLCGIARAIYHSTCMYGKRDIGGNE